MNTDGKKRGGFSKPYLTLQAQWYSKGSHPAVFSAGDFSRSTQKGIHMIGSIAGDIIGSVYEHSQSKTKSICGHVAIRMHRLWRAIETLLTHLPTSKTHKQRPDDGTDRVLEIRKEQGLTSQYIFTYSKRTISRVDRAFKGALSRAGIENCRFHDHRHTFASHLIMRGTDLKDIQELLGHKTMTMTLRYAHRGQTLEWLKQFYQI